jgi:RNA polymerase sigma factor (sigma-70 family)
MVITEEQIEEYSRVAADMAMRRPHAGLTYEELRQEARVACWEAATRYDGTRGTSLRTWVMLRACGHIRNTIEARIRRPICGIESIPASAMADRRNVPGDGFEELLQGLPPEQVSVLTYLFYGGLTLQEVARVMRCSFSWVRYLRDAALVSVRVRLDSLQKQAAIAD